MIDVQENVLFTINSDSILGKDDEVRFMTHCKPSQENNIGTKRVLEFKQKLVYETPCKRARRSSVDNPGNANTQEGLSQLQIKMVKP